MLVKKKKKNQILLSNILYYRQVADGCGDIRWLMGFFRYVSPLLLSRYQLTLVRHQTIEKFDGLNQRMSGRFDVGLYFEIGKIRPSPYIAPPRGRSRFSVCGGDSIHAMQYYITGEKLYLSWRNVAWTRVRWDDLWRFASCKMSLHTLLWHNILLSYCFIKPY